MKGRPKIRNICFIYAEETMARKIAWYPSNAVPRTSQLRREGCGCSDMRLIVRTNIATPTGTRNHIL